MPQVVTAGGVAPPHHTPPAWTAADRAVLVNTEQPTAGTGWDVEAAAFH